jgi:hypothetical protein
LKENGRTTICAIYKCELFESGIEAGLPIAGAIQNQLSK